MNNIYELFIFVANSGIDFKDIYKGLNEPLKSEVLDFIEFLKTNPTPEEYAKNKISIEVFNAYFFLVRDIIENLK